MGELLSLEPLGEGGVARSQGRWDGCGSLGSEWVGWVRGWIEERRHGILGFVQV